MRQTAGTARGGRSPRATALRVGVLLAVSVAVVAAVVAWDASRSPGAAPSPSVVGGGDGRPAAVVSEFAPSADGIVVGLRVWRPSSDVGPAFVALWTQDGDRLVSVRLPDGTAGGWRPVALEVPVAVAAQDRYVVSIDSSLGSSPPSQPFQLAARGSVLSDEGAGGGAARPWRAATRRVAVDLRSWPTAQDTGVRRGPP